MPKNNNLSAEYRYYFLPNHFPVLLLSGQFWTVSPDREDKSHFHNCMEIGLCVHNRGEMEIYGERYPYRNGDFTVIPRNVPHSTYAYPGESSLWCYLMIDPEELFHNLFPGSWTGYDLYSVQLRGDQYILYKEDYPEIYDLLQQIITELKEQKPSYQAVVRGLLLAFYMKIFRIQNARAGQNAGGLPRPSESRLIIAPALDYIETNYMQQFTVEFLADLCHFSATHFRRVFHELMGTSPLDFVNTTRILKACNLLRNTKDPVLNISEAVGFHSVSSFNRLFIRLMGISPREYRRKMRSPELPAEGLRFSQEKEKSAEKGQAEEGGTPS